MIITLSIEIIHRYFSGIFKIMKSTLKIVRFLLIMCGVFCAETDEVKSVSVMEGDSVTLNPDLTQIKGIVLLLWRFGDKGSTIAQIDEDEILYNNNEIFKDRLQLDQSGSLTINNTRTKHTGLYEAEISHNTGTLYIKFRLTVYESPSVIDAGEANMKLMSVTEGDPVDLHVPPLYGDELIVWRFGDEGKLIAKHDIEAKNTQLYEETDERFRDRLKLDNQTGSLSITNTRTTNAGLYNAKISSNKQTLYQKYFVTVSVPGLSPAAVVGIVVVVVLLVIVAAAGVLFYWRRTSELKNQKSKISKRQNETLEISDKLKQMSEISEELKEMTEDCEKELQAEISKHHQTLRISERLKQMLKNSEQLKQMSEECEKELRKISERLKQMCADATKEEMEKGERERCIVFKDTAISQEIGGPHGADRRVLDMHGKSLVVLNTTAEHTGVHESTGKGGNEETPFY